MDNKIGIYMLTVKGSDRHKHMSVYLKQFGNTKFIFGKKFNFNDNFFNETEINYGWNWYSNNIDKNRAYSCAYGHYEIVKEFANSTNNWALICEDDIILPENIIEICNILIDTYKYNWYHLSTHARYIQTYQQNNVNTDKLICVMEHYLGIGAGCYLINKEIAIKYINIFNKNNDICRVPADIFLWDNFGIEDYESYNKLPESEKNNESCFINCYPIVYNSLVKFDNKLTNKSLIETEPIIQMQFKYE